MKIGDIDFGIADAGGFEEVLAIEDHQPTLMNLSGGSSGSNAQPLAITAGGELEAAEAPLTDDDWELAKGKIKAGVSKIRSLKDTVLEVTAPAFLKTYEDKAEFITQNIINTRMQVSLEEMSAEFENMISKKVFQDGSPVSMSKLKKKLSEAVSKCKQMDACCVIAKSSVKKPVAKAKAKA